jgi:hypothetical protein
MWQPSTLPQSEGAPRHDNKRRDILNKKIDSYAVRCNQVVKRKKTKEESWVGDKTFRKLNNFVILLPNKME